MPVRSHRRRAPLLRVVRYVAVAVVLNALIALGCALSFPVVGYKNIPISASTIRWLHSYGELPDGTEVIVSWSLGWRVASVPLRDPEFDEQLRARYQTGGHATWIPTTADEWRIGFPFYCQRGRSIFHSSKWLESQRRTNPMTDFYESRGLLKIGNRPLFLVEWAPYVPLIPIWWGWLLNVLIYAMALAFICPAIKRRWGRQARRQRKGLCPQCAYDLKADLTIGCPECGWRHDKPLS